MTKITLQISQSYQFQQVIEKLMKLRGQKASKNSSTQIFAANKLFQADPVFRPSFNYSCRKSSTEYDLVSFSIRI